ncbi:MAG: hypothetical protein GY826_25120 [Fuerstiella sp.]|nr:hypothetical protein [Fuerstiella sp.]
MFANTYPIGRMVVFVSIIFCVPFINGTPTEAADRPPDSGTFLQTLLYEVQPLVGSNSPNENSWMRFSVLSNESHDSRRSDCLPERVISEGFTSQLEATEVFRAQSPGGCTGITEGCGYAEKQTPHFRLTEFNIYPTFSYLDDSSATYNEFEFASHTDFGFVEMENRTVLNVADLPGTIALGPTNPGDPGGSARRSDRHLHLGTRLSQRMECRRTGGPHRRTTEQVRL